MKVVKAALETEAAPRWGYVAFVSLMLYLVRRAGMKDVAGEVRLVRFSLLSTCCC